MRFGVLGTGMVGHTIAGKLVAIGHEVMMGSRDAANEKAVAWAAQAGDRAHAGTFAEAAAFGEVVVNATSGAHSLDALRAAGAANLSGKPLLDLANPLDFSSGFPPTLTVSNTDSLAEQVQREFPDARVVKTLNTINADVMVDPSLAPGTNIFVGGNDAAAKHQTIEILASFGWPEKDIVDLGDISTARGTEMYLPLWLHMRMTIGHSRFNIRIVRQDEA